MRADAFLRDGCIKFLTSFDRKKFRDRMKRIVKIGVGWFFLFLGVLGCFLPVLQGALFMAIGVLILSEESRVIKQLLHPFEQKYPRHFQNVYAFRRSVFHTLRQWLRLRPTKGQSADMKAAPDQSL